MTTVKDKYTESKEEQDKLLKAFYGGVVVGVLLTLALTMTTITKI